LEGIIKEMLLFCFEILLFVPHHSEKTAVRELLKLISHLSFPKALGFGHMSKGFDFLLL